jgi:uncharacterized protein YjbJ (UPF0337 family)
MDTEQIKGKVQQGVGKVKEGVGQAIGDSKTEASGQNDQVEGKIRETVGKVRNQAGTANPVEHAADRLGDAKDRVVNTIEDANQR